MSRYLPPEEDAIEAAYEQADEAELDLEYKLISHEQYERTCVLIRHGLSNIIMNDYQFWGYRHENLWIQ